MKTGLGVFLAGVVAASPLAPQAIAQSVYKCQSAAGKLSYSDEPCAGAGEKLLIAPNTLSSASMRESMLREENDRLKEQIRNPQQGRAAPVSAAPQNTAADLQAARIDTIACTRAKRDYEVTASSSANTPAIIDAKRSAMYGSCGMREPDQNRTIVIQRVPVFR